MTPSDEDSGYVFIGMALAAIIHTFLCLLGHVLHLNSYGISADFTNALIPTGRS